ncbi:MAG: hypothetical protein HFI09_04130, partial [Bacilli bacterium]|nr:hypothetical protein [Bacilli bacterium]
IPRLDYYQKVVNVFNTFDFDHLTDEEKKDLLQDIKNGEFISNETQANLNITDKELKNIQNDLLTKLEDISDNNEEVKKSVITKYLNAIKNADESYFELLQSVLTIEKIRENEQNVACLSDEEISSLINEIKEKGIEITLSKILELPEVVAFVNPLLEKIEQAKTLEEINQVEEELINFANSKQMLGLTDFNKNLLVNKLQSLISEQKKVIGFKEKTDEFLSEWREHIKDTETKDLMSLYDEFDRFTKKDIGLKDIDDEELNILKDILKDYVLDELALRIYNDLGGPEEENLDIIKDKVAKMTKEDFEKYNISEDLKDEIVKRLNDRIEKTKTARQEIDQEVAEILEIGTKVTLTKDVPVYENEKCYDEDQQLNENLIKANTKGKITGYVVKKDDSIIVLNSKEDLKNHFKQGYNIIGYEYNYKRLFKNNYTYVELDDVMPIKQKDQKKWSIKKILMTITLAMATMLAATGVFKGYQKNKDRNASPRVAIENETPELNNCINVDGEMVELDEEVIDTLNKMPSTESNWRITEDARIFANADEVGKTKGQTSYFNTHKEYDLDRTFGGYVLKDQDGNTLICMDRNEAFHLIADDNYEYIGIRGLNKYSKNDQDYEGIFTDDSIFNEDSLLNELQEKGVSRRLTK